FSAVRDVPVYSLCLTLLDTRTLSSRKSKTQFHNSDFRRVAEACRGSSASSLDEEALESARLKIQLSETGLAIKTRSAHSQVQILPSAPKKKINDSMINP